MVTGPKEQKFSKVFLTVVNKHIEKIEELLQTTPPDSYGQLEIAYPTEIPINMQNYISNAYHNAGWDAVDFRIVRGNLVIDFHTED